MRIIKKMLMLPISLILGLLKLIIILLIKAACRVAGVGLPLLTIFVILALVNKMWLQVGIFSIIIIAGAVILLLSAHILLCVEELRCALKY